MQTCIPSFRADGHRCRGEVLNLLETEIESFGYCREFRHVFGCASWVAADEVWYNLLVEVFPVVYFVKYALESEELFERWFAHEFQNTVGSMFGCHLQTSAHMSAYQFTSVFPVVFVDRFIIGLVEQKVIAHSATYEALLYALYGIDTAVNVEQRPVVSVEVLADLGRYARRTLAFLA